MEHKKELLEMIQNLSDTELIECIFVFVRRFVKNWGN